jgi:hypothetical protein
LRGDRRSKANGDVIRCDKNHAMSGRWVQRARIFLIRWAVEPKSARQTSIDVRRAGNGLGVLRR